MGFFRKKKVNTEINLSDGIVMKQPLQMETSSWLKNCMVKSILVFSVVFGSIGCFLSSFDLEYYVILTAIVLFSMALLFTTIYYKNWIMDVAYVVFLVVFFFAVQGFWTYINSGYYLLINRILQTVEDYFELPGMQYYEIAAENQVLAVSVVVIFIGTVMMIVANVIISRTMNVWFLLAITGFLWILPMYFRLEADAFYVILMLTGYIAVWSIRSSGAYGIDRKHRDYQWKDRKGKKLRIWYVQDAATILEVLGVFIVSVLFLYGTSSVIGQKDTFNLRYRQNPYKEESEVMAQELSARGFSMFNRYEAVGGISGGRLGGVGAVVPDYQTDLVVTFAPYSYEPVYLKAFTGIDYVSEDFQWLTYAPTDLSSSVSETPFQPYDLRGYAYESEVAYQLYEQGLESCGVMWIRNVGANVSYPYIPYYTPNRYYWVTDDTEEKPELGNLTIKYDTLSVVTGEIPRQRTAEYLFFPPGNEEELQREGERMAKSTDAHLFIRGFDEKYRLSRIQAEEWYLTVPEECYDAVAAASEAAGIHAGDSQGEIIQKVKDYFETEFRYTTRPGRSPRNKDFITHFLEEKRGYCTHFATAATMIYRYNGIPARYIEGYVITYEDVMGGELMEEYEYEDFYEGDSPLGKTGVVEVEVSDARAHAWVEVFTPYVGWTSEEVTTAAVEPDEELESFWDVFGSDSSGEAGVDIGNGFRLDAMNWNLDDIRGIWIGLIVVLVVLVMIAAGRRGYQNWKDYQSWHTDDMNENLLAYYHIMSGKLRKKNSEYAQCPTYRWQLRYIAAHCEEWNWDTEHLAELLEQACYSREGISEFECRRLMIELTDIAKKVKKWKHS